MVRMREALSRSQKRTSLRPFPELIRRNRTRNKLPLIEPQKIGKAVRNTTRMLSMVFEVIQPDLEINRRHVATPLNPQQSAGGEPLRAFLWRDSGKFWQGPCGGVPCSGLTIASKGDPSARLAIKVESSDSPDLNLPWQEDHRRTHNEARHEHRRDKRSCAPRRRLITTTARGPRGIIPNRTSLSHDLR